MKLTLWGVTLSQNRTERGRNPQARWARKKRLRSQLAWMIVAAAADEGQPLPPMQDLPPACKMRVKLTLYRPRRFDKDNATGGAKILIDALRDCRLIKNDSPRWLELEVEQVIEPNKELERTEVEIDPATSNRGGAQ